MIFLVLELKEEITKSCTNPKNVLLFFFIIPVSVSFVFVLFIFNSYSVFCRVSFDNTITHDLNATKKRDAAIIPVDMASVKVRTIFFCF